MSLKLSIARRYQITRNGHSLSISSLAMSGVFWLLVQSVSGRVLLFLSQILLARILLPADFGILSISLTVISIIQILASFGVDDVLLQRQKSISLWSSAAFWTALSLASTGFVVVAISAPFLAAIFHASSLSLMLPIMGLSMPISALSMVSYVQLRADLRFKRLAHINLAEQVVAVTLTIGLATMGFGAMSFAIPLPFAAVVRTIILLKASPVRFRRTRMAQYRRMTYSGGLVLGSRLSSAVINQGNLLLLGLFASPTELGLYFFAFRLAVQPIIILSGNFNSVFFPAFAQIGKDSSRMVNAAVKAGRILALILIPYCLLQALAAPPVMKLLFGNRWNDAILSVQILSLGLGFDCVAWIAGSYLSARGEFRRSLKYMSIQVALFITLTSCAVLISAQAFVMALFVACYYIFSTPIYTYMAFSGSGVGVRIIFSMYLLPFFYGCIAYVPLYFLTSFLTNPIMVVLITSVLGTSIYIGLARIGMSESWYEICSHLKVGRFKRIFQNY